MKIDRPKSSLTMKDHQFSLSDGRTLSYLDNGRQGSTTIVLLHGFPASRYDSKVWVRVADRHNARLLAPDRPGIGNSTFLQARTICDYPADILELMDHLQISTFNILATAGGCPYALACARNLPSARLHGVAVVSGIFPLSYGAKDMHPSSRVALFVAAWAASFFAWLIDLLVGRTARKDADEFEKLFMREASSRPSVDRKCLEDSEFRHGVLDSFRNAFAQGGWGVAWDAHLLGSDWGFSLEDIPTLQGGIRIYQGSLDYACPVSMAQTAAMKLKGAELVVGSGEGHLSMIYGWSDHVLANLLGTATVSVKGGEIVSLITLRTLRH